MGSLLTYIMDIIFIFMHSIQHLAEESSTEPDSYRLDLSVVVQSILAKFSANTGFLESTEWYLVGQHVVVVDPDGSSLELVGDPDGGVEVCGVDGRGKTICGFISGLDDFVLSLELADGADGSENLLLHDLHVVANTGEDGGLDEVSLASVSLTTSLNLCTGILSGLDVAHDSVELQLADLRTLEGVGAEWVANNILGGSGLELLDELVVDAGLYVDSRTSATALAVVEENTEVDP